MTKEEQLSIINDTIKKTKYNLKPLGYSLIFWSVVVISMSLFHYFFPQIVQYSYYSSTIYWVSIPLLGMVYTTYYNIKTGIKIGYETQLGRVIRIIWAVFGFAWIFCGFGVDFGRAKWFKNQKNGTPRQHQKLTKKEVQRVDAGRRG